ncbi:MAG: DUF3048 domain-containing protein [Actinomycetota bacterium]|nr:DUF3048 domain-containing protein [Actinomycetota bacterium]
MDQDLTGKRPVAVKIGNDPAARPQSGLEDACLVYEELTEGGITRFLAFYLCQEADPIGPIRSARPVDIELVYPFRAALAHCGAGAPVLEMIRNSGIADIDELQFPDAYWRTRDRRAPQNLYTSTEKIRNTAGKRYSRYENSESAFDFLSSKEEKQIEEERKRKQAGGSEESEIVVANTIDIPFSQPVRYVYEPASRFFLRFISGKPHIERGSEKQIHADTVIVQYVTEATSGIRDVYGSDSPALGAIGSGDAEVFMLGACMRCSWEKSSRYDHTHFLDSNGEEIKIRRGNIWIELVPVSKRSNIS